MITCDDLFFNTNILFYSKKNFKENGEKLSNLDKKLCDVTDNNINTFSKPLYSSFFKENKHLNDLNAKFFQKNNITLKK